jgi:hypothetical protein
MTQHSYKAQCKGPKGRMIRRTLVKCDNNIPHGYGSQETQDDLKCKVKDSSMAWNVMKRN